MSKLRRKNGRLQVKIDSFRWQTLSPETETRILAERKAMREQTQRLKARFGKGRRAIGMESE